MLGVAVDRVQHLHALEVEPDVVLVGDPDAAVELDRLLGHEPAALGELDLGRRHRGPALAGVASSIRIAAASEAEYASSVSMNMSTARCWSTWKLPILTPNCSRVRRYSTVIASTA